MLKIQRKRSEMKRKMSEGHQIRSWNQQQNSWFSLFSRDSHLKRIQLDVGLLGPTSSFRTEGAS